jgi:hypothetical protein
MKEARTIFDCNTILIEDDPPVLDATLRTWLIVTVHVTREGLSPDAIRTFENLDVLESSLLELPSNM